jgi:hypothetical protein
MINPPYLTREQIGRMTLMDLRLLAHEKAPPEPGSRPKVPIPSVEAYNRVMAQRTAEANSWDSQ